jgi:1-phosphofructokinase family hexose kinase
MLRIVTPNPALDRTMVVPGVRMGERHRAEQVIVAAGGKGLNVARVAKMLGQQLEVYAPLGGWTGQYVAHLCREEEVPGCWTWLKTGETRTCILLVDPHAGDATPLDEHGPQVEEHDWISFFETILAVASESSMVVIAGSLPPGVHPREMAFLIQDLADNRCPMIVDTSGEPLQAAIEAAPYAIKVNRAELSQALGKPADRVEQVVELLAELHQRGVALAIASLGAEGAIAANSEGIYHAYPPDHLPVVSTVGSGDALTAGLATGLLRGDALPDALRLGVACGSANALTLGGGTFHISDMKRILEQTTGTWLGLEKEME